jgi:hypothetical protein
MKNFFQSRIKVLCAFCRSPRKIHRKRHAGKRDYLAAALGATIFMVLVFGGFDGRALLAFILFVVVAEIFVQLRWRVGIKCPQCGFDPVLYGKDASAAASVVKEHLEARKLDPRSLFARPLNLPVRRITDQERKIKGQNLSREL